MAGKAQLITHAIKEIFNIEEQGILKEQYI